MSIHNVHDDWTDLCISLRLILFSVRRGTADPGHWRGYWNSLNVRGSVTARKEESRSWDVGTQPEVDLSCGSSMWDWRDLMSRWYDNRRFGWSGHGRGRLRKMLLPACPPWSAFLLQPGQSVSLNRFPNWMPPSHSYRPRWQAFSLQEPLGISQSYLDKLVSHSLRSCSSTVHADTI